MDVVTMINPALVADILAKDFLQMAPAEFAKHRARFIEQADRFAQNDDSKFSGELSEADATMYACHARTFQEALQELKREGERQSIGAFSLARTIAWWKVISTFYTIHGRSV